jgi:hypothetical protein
MQCANISCVFIQAKCCANSDLCCVPYTYSVALWYMKMQLLITFIQLNSFYNHSTPGVLYAMRESYRNYFDSRSCHFPLGEANRGHSIFNIWNSVRGP